LLVEIVEKYALGIENMRKKICNKRMETKTRKPCDKKLILIKKIKKKEK